MLEILKSIVDDPQTLAALLGVGIALVDMVLGKLPDKVIPYVGIIRRVIEAYLARKATKK